MLESLNLPADIRKLRLSELKILASLDFRYSVEKRRAPCAEFGNG